MIVALVVIIVVLVSTATIGHHLEKAPEGFEDRNGFHFATGDGSSASAVTAHGALVGADKRVTAASLL